MPVSILTPQTLTSPRNIPVRDIGCLIQYSATLGTTFLVELKVGLQNSRTEQMVGIPSRARSTVRLHVTVHYPTASVSKVLLSIVFIGFYDSTRTL